ncbi:MAG TPA: hypothetical protein VMF89_09760, partial [Polyangiales bacterium]|nr:hypothetical protein [Polyangiales bacterium]
MRFAAWLTVAALSLVSASVRADPFEFMRALTLHPSDPRLMALRYENAYGGLLLSRDGGHTFSLLPSLAIGSYPLRGHSPMLFARDGTLLVATDSSVLVDDGTGCRFGGAGPLEDKWVADIAPHPSDPDVIFALTVASQEGDGHAGLWRRTASALTPLGTSDPAPGTQRRHRVLPTSLKVVARAASAGGLRFVVGAVVSEDGDPSKPTKHALRVSDDQGATWTTHEIPTGAGVAGVPLLLAIEGSDPFRALVALQVGLNEDTSEQSGPEPVDPIFLTTDSAATFSPHNAGMKMGDQALLLPSGQVLIADRGRGGGLWSAASIDAPLSKIQEEPVHCLAYRPETDTVFMCRGHELGVLDLAANSFCAFFQMNDVLSLQSCPSQPIEGNKQAIDQLCNKWCGAQHFSSSPACASSPALASCVAFGRAYDADAGIVEAPGDFAAPSCPPPALPPP